MKKILRKIIYGYSSARDYVAITGEEPFPEKVYLKTGNLSIDVSSSHWLLCLDPIIYDVWLSKEILLGSLDDDCSLVFSISPPQKTVAVLKLSLINRFNEDEGCFLLFKQTKCRICHINFIKLYSLFLLYFKKKEITFEKLRSFIAAFSYPRKVRLISFLKDDYYNLFPMDLLGKIPNHRKFVFGLRHTNRSLKRIIETKKIVVAEFSYHYSNEVLKLGKHHSSNPPAITDLGFTTVHSKNFGFPLPGWITGYYEIEIENTMNLGSQMFMKGSVVSAKEAEGEHHSMYHIHFVHYFLRKKLKIETTLV